MMAMNWDDLRYALAVAERGSLSSAAELLGVNASTVLRRIAALEKSVGARLFERDQTGYRVTQEGGDLIASLRPIQDRIARIARSFSTGEEGGESVVRIAAPSALAGALIAPRLGQFRVENPGLSVLIETNDGSPPNRLGMLDLALSYGRPVAGDMVIRKLADIGYGLYAIPELLSRYRNEHTDSGEFIPLVGFASSNQLMAPMVWLEKYANPSQTVLRSDDANCRLSAMLTGVGQTILPCFLADQLPGVTRLHGPESVGGVELWLATHKEARHVARIRVLADFLIKLTRDRRQRLAGSS